MNSSRRNFIAAGLTLPVAGLARTTTTASERTAPDAPKDRLRYRTLGKTGLKVTSVGFGCMITSDATVIEKAADTGINYFDTARGYQGGNNERMVGAALKSRRKQLVISTKTGAGTKEGALQHLETSLQTLGTDYVDIWYLHGKGKAEDLKDELIEAQQLAKQQGKIRFAGVSTHGGQASVIDGAIKSGKIDVVLLSYNFTMGQEIEDAIVRAKQAGIGLVAMKVMAGGSRRIKESDKLFPILKKEGAMLAALKWVLKNPKMDTTIPSMTDADQLEENLKAMTEPFSETDQKTLTAFLDHIRPAYCRMCGSCDGKCPKGLPVADVLRYLTYAEGYGQFALGREHFLTLPEHVAGVRCGDCSECTIQCPNGVRVPERLARAQELFA